MAAVDEILKDMTETLNVRRVFGEPIERDGVTFVPVASIRGGGGGGSGGEEAEGPSGAGAGFGVMARPVGAYVIRGESVEWHPAMDVMRIAVAGMALAGLISVMIGKALARR